MVCAYHPTTVGRSKPNGLRNKIGKNRKAWQASQPMNSCPDTFEPPFTSFPLLLPLLTPIYCSLTTCDSFPLLCDKNKDITPNDIGREYNRPKKRLSNPSAI